MRRETGIHGVIAADVEPGQVSLHAEGDLMTAYVTSKQQAGTRSGLPPCGGRQNHTPKNPPQGAPGQVSLHAEGDFGSSGKYVPGKPGQVSLHAEGDSKTAQESVFHFAYPCTILQKRMQKTTFCTRKNGFFRKKGEKFGAKPSASFCAPMIRTDTFPLNFSHRISGSSMSMVSFAPICSTFD